MTEQTHFGFEGVSFEEKTKRVMDVFRRVASNYDLMNDLMSLGIHRLWKDHMVMDLTLAQNSRVLDVAGGTGDIAFRLAKTYPHLNLQITVCDLTSAMVEVGRDRAINQGLLPGKGINWVCGNAENLPVADNSQDLYTIAYGLRNVTHIDKALAEAFRVLKTGGKFVCLEFSHITMPPLQQIYDFYSFKVLPTLGEYVAKDRDAYQYLVESIRQFPDQETLAEMIKSAGFSTVNWQNLCNGISCIHTGIKQ
ncbi:MAG: bifunctional demethylmenaquinone methyltransferase/2-methoxy-6-polyprenyl-1,4-benzoquinol methylase UbiE [Alphaproteobacteria bacterium]|jgi:demethylmenaquinone methyltransferase/2-methoxy-6-polyprenyl-1,4-benzoquinol methylase|nr:bifunctional demethylmenaquinone methyltransferase/2-methoxy-6-polyprenyl-1,4-benzoquinol methylase UbiE [Alphaproteobacteria bacterium]